MHTSAADAEVTTEGEGLTVANRVGPAHGAAQLRVDEATLTAGARVPPRISPFEESFFVLAGEALVAIETARYALRPGDFGIIPFGAPHAWANTSDADFTCLRVRAPAPRHDGRTVEAYGTDLVTVPSDGEPVQEGAALQRFVGHFADEQLPPYGSLAMPGARSYSINNISQRFMIDGLTGAAHHTLFVVEFAPAEGFSASEHFHPFEEMYYFLSGRASGIVDGREIECEAGDVVFTGVGVTHGFTTLGDEPVRWIEAQAPIPPVTNGTTFVRDWSPRR